VNDVDPAIALCGNIDPVAVLYNGTPEGIRQAVMACRDAGGPNWLAAPGCEVPRHTRADNLHAFGAALDATN
jgi:uroporphyrinogen-III decarboxylase